MIKERLESLRLRAGQMMRERKERAAEKRAAKAAERRQGGHDSRFWLLSIPATATLCAAFVEVYWATLFCIEATGSLDGSWSTSLGSAQAAAGAWHFVFDIRNVFVLVGLIAATIPIVMWSMVWLPVQMKARGHGRWRRTTMIVAGLLANALVIISGTVVMNSNRQDQVRAQLVTEQSADQGRAALVAQRDAIHQRWATLTDSSNTTLQAQAARAGTAGWASYIATARQQLAAGTISQQRFDLIERAQGSAVAAEAYQQQMDAMTGRIAASAPVAATQAVVQDNVGIGLNTFAQYATVYRPPFVALICTIIGIFGAWWWVGLAEAMDRHSISLSGWADEAHRIEDLRAEEPVTAQPMKPPREVVTDAETGEELIRVTPKPHWRKRKPQKVDINPEVPPDETGVAQDGGQRIGTKGEHEPLTSNVQSHVEDHQDNSGDDGADRHEPSTLPNVARVSTNEHAANEGADEGDEQSQEHQPTFSLEQDDIEAFSYADDESAATAAVEIAPHEDGQDESDNNEGANEPHRPAEVLTDFVGNSDSAHNKAEDSENGSPDLEAVQNSAEGGVSIDHQSPPPATEPETQEADEPQAITNPARLIAAE